MDKLETVKLLLDHGCDIEAKTTTGDTPLCIAIYSEQWAIVEELVQRGACYETVVSRLEEKRQRLLDIVEKCKASTQ